MLSSASLAFEQRVKLKLVLLSTQIGAHQLHRPAWAAAAGAGLAALLVYACTLGGTYVYDDVAIVQDDPRIQQPARWSELWTRPYFPTSRRSAAVDPLYRPLVSSSFAIERWIHGDRPWAFHLVNVLLHVAASLTVALLGVRLGGLAVGWVAGVLFAVHPVHVEAVAGLVGRCELMCALATLLGIYVFLRAGPTTAARVVAIWACFVAAVLSKEQGVLFPLLLLAAAPLRRGEPKADNARQLRLWLIVLICWSLATYLLIRQQVAPVLWDRRFLDWDVNPLVRSVGLDRILMPFVLLGRYVALLAFPVRLSIDYGATVIGWKVSFRDPYFYVGLIAALTWGAGAIVSYWRRNWAMLFCLIAMAVSYGMIGNILLLIGTIFGERLFYLPSAFVLVAIAMILARLPRRTLVPVTAALAIAAGIRACVYARQWNDRLSFYRASITAQPKSERVYALLWHEYKQAGIWQAARQVAQEAKRQVPECWQSYAMCIESELAQGEFDAADAAADEGLAVYRDLKDLDRMHLIQWKQVVAAQRAAARQTK